MRQRLRWLFRRRLCFGGLAGALVFFCLSLTPSLLPRGVMLQGVISGITAVIGYGVGSGASAAVRKLRPPSRSRRDQADRVVGAARRDRRARAAVPAPRSVVAERRPRPDGHGVAAARGSGA